MEIGVTLAKALKATRKKQVESKLAGTKWNNDLNLVCSRNDGHFMAPNTFSKLFRNKVKELGLDMTFHGLRHTHTPC